MAIDACQTEFTPDAKNGTSFQHLTFQWKVFTVTLSVKEFERSEFGGHCSEVSLSPFRHLCSAAVVTRQDMRPKE